MAARVLNFTNSERIIRAGDNDRRMYIILDGMVQITLRDGVDSFVVATMRKGDFFGEMSLFCNRPRTADVIAVGSVRLTYIESMQELRKFLTVALISSFVSVGGYLAVGYWIGEPAVALMEAYGRFLWYVSLAILLGMLANAWWKNRNTGRAPR